MGKLGKPKMSCTELFYFVFPALLTSIAATRPDSPIIPIISARTMRPFEWLGIACGLLGLFFAIRNYFFGRNASTTERSMTKFLARLCGRSLD